MIRETGKEKSPHHWTENTPFSFTKTGNGQGSPLSRKDRDKSVKWGSGKVGTASETTVDLDQERKDLLNPGKKDSSKN